MQFKPAKVSPVDVEKTRILLLAADRRDVGEASCAFLAPTEVRSIALR